MSSMNTFAMVVGRVGSSLWHRSFSARWFSIRESLTGLAAVISLLRPQTAMDGWLYHWTISSSIWERVLARPFFMCMVI